MKDKNNYEIHVFDLVEVPDPILSDNHNQSFVGTVKNFRNDNVVIEDMDGDYFEIEPYRLIIQEY